MQFNELITAQEATKLFTSYVDRLSTIYNDGLSDTSPEIQMDAVFQCTKRRIEGFMTAHENFKLVQTVATLPKNGNFGEDVVNALESNDFGYLINKYKIDVKITEPMVIQTLIPEPIEMVSDNGVAYKLRGGILMINPNEKGFIAEMSMFTEIDDIEGLGICHHTEKYKYGLIEGEPNFIKIHGSGFMEQVSVTSFETYLLMQIPFYLMFKGMDVDKPYLEVEMKGQPKIEVKTTDKIQ